jgi:MoaA/NifB/PqqE/SkfB family radical SAM enzyme
MKGQDLFLKIKKGINDPRLFLEKVENDLNALNIKNAYNDPKGLSPFPRHIFVGVNSTCNFRCKMCDFGQRETDKTFYKMLKAGGGELSMETLTNLVNDVKGFKPIILITTTEPLLFGNLEPFCALLKRNGLKLSITTNGYLLEKNAEMLSSYANAICVSLDGPGNIHNEIRGVKDAFERAGAGIEKVRECGGPKIDINYTISDANYWALEEFYNEVKDWHVRRVTFSHLNYVTPEIAREHNDRHSELGEITSSSLSSVELEKIDIDVLHRQIANLRRRPDVWFVPDIDGAKLSDYYRKPSIFITKPICLVPWRVGQIMANGNVVVMTRCFAKPFGNINEQKFTDIWKNEKFRNFRRALSKFGAVKACSRCCGIL